MSMCACHFCLFSLCWLLSLRNSETSASPSVTSPPPGNSPSASWRQRTWRRWTPVDYPVGKFCNYFKARTLLTEFPFLSLMLLRVVYPSDFKAWVLNNVSKGIMPQKMLCILWLSAWIKWPRSAFGLSGKNRNQTKHCFSMRVHLEIYFTFVVPLV